MSAAPLHHRGWALQERVLPPRTLHFTEHQIFWECFLDQKCEAFPGGIPAYVSTVRCKPDFDSAKDDSVFRLWEDTVELYTRCSLTKSDDKMVAISGLAKLYKQRINDEYIAGMWRSRLLNGLNWFVLRGAERTSSEYRAPSWSWAATDGEVSFAWIKDPQIARVLDVEIVHSQVDDTGKVLGGHIDLEAVVIAMTLYKKNIRELHYELRSGDHIAQSPLVYEDNIGEDIENYSDVHCLALTHSRQVKKGSDQEMHLVLRAMLLKLKETEGIYTRIGYVDFGIFGDDETIKLFGIGIDPETKEIVQDETRRSKIRIL